MPRIRPLDPQVVNKIAAGEVIERPASVLKELLENSLDALATRVSVEVESGGSGLIRVRDDGEGIAAEDLPLAVTAHATSKLETAEDLFSVATLGFRGEALASIASVSRFRLTSRPADADAARELFAEGGMFGKPVAKAAPHGTTVEVRDLFFNTPARRKFLRTAATEFGHLAEQFTRLALANPRLHAVLRHNGKTVHELPATDRLLDRLTLFFGAELAGRLIPVESKSGQARLWGFAGHPADHRSTRKGQYLFLNGRFITDRSLQHALSEAYRGLVMVGRHPVAFLFLETPPDAADVNVHPTKSEVRFADGAGLYRQLLSTLRTKFLSLDFDQEFHVPGPSRATTTPDPRVRGESLKAADPERRLELETEFADWAAAALAGASGDDPGPRVFADADPPDAANPQAGGGESEQPRTTGGTGSSRAMQVLDTYLVLETDGGLQLIDQHALHERVMYESLRPRVLDGSVEVQRLLVPEPVELDARQAAAVVEHADTLKQLGFEVEEFGGTTVLVNGYPVLLRRGDPAAILRDAADTLADRGKTDRRELLDSLLHMMSCKAAVKAGQRLSETEIDSLLAARHLVDDAHHCPHGRPTALTLSRDELDRQFGRMG